MNQETIIVQALKQQAKDKAALVAFGFDTTEQLIEQLKKSFPTFSNILLGTDVYKMGHMEQMKKGVTKIVAYLVSRSDKHYSHMVISGFTHIFSTYLSRKITREHCLEFLENKKAICSLAKATHSTEEESRRKIMSLADLGYIPLEIKALPEGTVMKSKNMIATITNTHKDFAWCVGFFESLILKVWESICVSSCVFAYRQTVDYFFNLSVDAEKDWLREYIIHDFGYRSTGTEEGAVVTSAAQLLLSKGSDSVPAREYVIRMLGAKRESDIMASPPASEHAVACSYGLDKKGELDYITNMLTTYIGVTSLVSDTKNVFDFVTDIAGEVKDLILTREGKTVFRPDSGNPEDIICGDPNAPVGSKEWKGVLQLLDEGFGHTVNKKGYKVLNEKVGLIYGDGMFLQRYVRTVLRMLSMGYSAENLIIGVGGILRMHTRDTLGMALKDLWMVIDDVPTDIQKDPITDPGKKSHKGLPALILNKDGDHETIDGCTMEQFENSLLETVFKDGQIIYVSVFADSRARASAGLVKYVLTKADIMRIADYP